VGAGRQQFAYDGVPGTHQWYDGTPHPWEFKRVWHLEPSLDDPDTVYAGVEDAASSAPPTAARPGRAPRAARATARDRRGSPAPAGCACTPSCSTPPTRDRMFVAISAAGRLPHRRRRQTWKAINRGLRRGHPRPRRRGRPLRAPHRDAPVAAERAVHAEALGRHAQRRRGRLVARGQRQPADRLRLPDRRARARAGDDLRRPDQERLGALPARRQAARLPQPHRRQRVGGADRTACRSATATSTCCATRWPSTRSTRAASTSAPPAGRSTPRPTPATLDADRPRPAAGAVGGGADAVVVERPDEGIDVGGKTSDEQVGDRESLATGRQGNSRTRMFRNSMGDPSASRHR
jgi:hypothetical protein